MKNININYRLTTFVLLGILALNTIWAVSNNKFYPMGLSHKMPSGEIMSDHNMESMMMDMTANMVGKSGKELEKSFITEMIPHHQGAVDMAKLLLEDKNINSELRTFANEIITAQEKEINQMKMWLNNY